MIYCVEFIEFLLSKWTPSSFSIVFTVNSTVLFNMDKLTVEEDRDDDDELEERSVFVLQSLFKPATMACDWGGGERGDDAVVGGGVCVVGDDAAAMTRARFDELFTIVIMPMLIPFFFDLNLVYILQDLYRLVWE